MQTDYIQLLAIVKSHQPEIANTDLIRIAKSKHLLVKQDDRSDTSEDTYRKRVERAMTKLLGMQDPILPLQKHGKGRNTTYSYPADEPLPSSDIDITLAMVLKFSQQFFTAVLPEVQKTQLSDYYNMAEDLFSKRNQNKRYRQFIERIGWHPEGFGNRLVPNPSSYINPGILEKLANALFEGQQIKMGYESRYNQTDHDYTLSPAGLVLRGQVIYLVAKYEHKGAPYFRHFHAGRIYSVELLDRHSKVPASFNLQEYLEQGAFEKDSHQEADDQEIEVELCINKYLKLLFEERMSNADFDNRDGDCYVSFKVKPYNEFIWWLLSFGSNVVVTKPPSLVKRLKDEVDAMHGQYNIE